MTPTAPPPAGPVDPAAYRDANDNRALTSGLAGTGIAILTFVMFFLYDRWTRGQVGTLLFEGTLLNIVVSVFLVSIASMNFWFVMEAVRSNHPEPAKYLRRAEGTFAVSWVLLLLEPTLVLASVGLYYAAAVAVLLWGATVVAMARGWSDARRPARR